MSAAPRFAALAPGLALLVIATACSDPGPASVADDLTDPELPARGAQDMPTWLAAGYYRDWHCEPAPHPGRAPSPHGENRVCNNAVLHAALSAGGAFPAGAAAVKEVFEGSAIVTYAVSRKVTAGDGGDRWYWYEGSDSDVFTSSQGARNCTNCHNTAARDDVFTLVP